MITKDISRTEFFQCACYSPEHTVCFSLSDIPEEHNVEFYSEVQLSQYRGFFGRIWLAIKYVLGYKSAYGHWDCWLLRDEDAPQLRDMITEYIEKKKEYEEYYEDLKKRNLGDQNED